MEKNRKAAIFQKRGLLGGAVAVVILLAAFFLCPLVEERGCAKISITPKPYQLNENLLDINTATAEQLQALPGIGPVLANRILSYREQHGGFQFVYELTDVEGIGAATFEKLRDSVTVGYSFSD